MTEVLKNMALAAGAFYLVYRIYCSYIRPFWSPRHGKGGPQKANVNHMKLPTAPQHDFLDVA